MKVRFTKGLYLKRMKVPQGWEGGSLKQRRRRDTSRERGPLSTVRLRYSHKRQVPKWHVCALVFTGQRGRHPCLRSHARVRDGRPVCWPLAFCVSKYVLCYPWNLVRCKLDIASLPLPTSKRTGLLCARCTGRLSGKSVFHYFA